MAIDWEGIWGEGINLQDAYDDLVADAYDAAAAAFDKLVAERDHLQNDDYQAPGSCQPASSPEGDIPPQCTESSEKNSPPLSNQSDIGEETDGELPF